MKEMKQALLIMMVFLIPILSSIYRIESAQNNLNNARHGRFEDDYYRYTAVGIFSICKDGINNNVNNNDNNNNYETPWTKNRTKFSEKAALSNRTIYMLTEHWKIYTDYISFDVCYNKSLLIEKLIHISLDIEYFRKSHPLDNNNYQKNSHGSLKNHFNVIVLFAYVTNDMSGLIEGISSLNDFPRLCQPVECDNRKSFLDIAKYASNLLETLKVLEWFDVTLVSLLKEDGFVYPYHRYYEGSYEILRQTEQFCLRGKSFNMKKWTIKEIAQILERVANHSVLILFADPVFQIKLLTHLHQVGRFKNTTIIAHDIERTEFLNEINVREHISTSPHWISINQQQRLVSLFLFNSMINVDGKILDSDIKFQVVFGWRILERVESLKSIFDKFDDQTFHSFIKYVSEFPFWKIILDYAWTKAFAHDPTETIPLYTNKTYKDHPSVQRKTSEHRQTELFIRTINWTVECSAPKCGAGYVIVYDDVINSNMDHERTLMYTSDDEDFVEETSTTTMMNVNGSYKNILFDKHHGPMCELCPINHVKYERKGGSAMNECQRCRGRLSIDDGFRTSCIDPYENRILILLDLQTSILHVLIYSGLILTVGISVVFVVRRQTVIVRVSDVHISLLHLGSLFVVYSTVWLTYTNAGVQLLLFQNKFDDGEIKTIDSYIGKRGICVARLLVKAIPYTMNVALLYTKSEKLLSAFLSKIKLTPGEIRKTTGVQIFTISCFLIVSNLLVAVFYRINKPDMVYVEENTDMSRIFQCNTLTKGETALNCFLVVCHLACLVQAFRGRKLPSRTGMNNAMTLVYASLITTTAFGVIFPISIFQSDRERMFMHGLVLLVNCHIMVMLLYGLFLLFYLNLTRIRDSISIRNVWIRWPEI